MAADSQILAGLGSKAITPREPIQMSGFARSQMSTGVHDDLYAKSLYLEDGAGRKAFLIAVSLIYLTPELVESIRAEIARRTGADPGSVIFSCTHTHAGPALAADFYTAPTPGTYPSYLVSQVAASAEAAYLDRRPSRIGFGRTEVFEMGRNRRALLYGGLHPDPEVLVMKIEDAGGNLRGVAFNYGCHPSTLDWQNTLISEDWPHYTHAEIMKKCAMGGGEIWSAYLQGAQGDINCGYSSELSAVGVDMPIRNYEFIAKKGRQLAAVVLGALPGIQTESRLDVSLASGLFDYPLRKEYPVTPDEAARDAEEAKAKLTEMEKNPAFAGTRRLDEARVRVFSTSQRLAVARRRKEKGWVPFLKIEHQALRVGKAVFLTIPGEVFSEIGLRIKAESRYDWTFLLGIANGTGTSGYLPPAKEFIQGDYEVDGCIYEPSAEDVMVAACRDVMKRVGG
ncbi:MAG TPA: neutral/alkaline non-lysosomal ceramidase N-terminal domain-containing protein [Candidatus Aminicenantes bacterium]|nr:neutral/alkaline non-lysosomal ceramidase N-terminal domain-containing protein [Candidatus Aminicenantes bacterium]